MENLCKIEGESILKIGNLIIQFGVGATSRNGSVNRLSNDFKKIISVVCVHSGTSTNSITAVINSANTFTSYFEWSNNDVKGMNYIAVGISK